MTTNDVRQVLWIVILSISCLSVGYSMASALNVTFRGTLKEWACEVVQADELEVAFPLYSIQDFEKTPRSEVEIFELKLRNCPVELAARSMSITFSAANGFTSVGGVRMLNTTGGTGVVIGLQNENGTAVQPGLAFSAGTVVSTGEGSLNTIRLGAFAQQPTTTKLNAGTYQSVITFAITYR